MNTILRKGSPTPWGKADDVGMYPNSVHCVHTPGHGGYAITPANLLALCDRGDGAQKTIERKERIRKSLFVNRAGRNVNSEGYAWEWFEEDCDYAILFLLIEKNGSPGLKEAFFGVGSNDDDSTTQDAKVRALEHAWASIQHFHPDLQEDLKLI